MHRFFNGLGYIPSALEEFDMWHNFVDLLLRILHGMPLLVSSNWTGWFLGLIVFVLYKLCALGFRG
jgi:hypothetical protein